MTNIADGARVTLHDEIAAILPESGAEGERATQTVLEQAELICEGWA